MTGNQLALGLSYLYLFVLIAVAELARKRLGARTEHTRTIVHVGIGMWSVPTVYLFSDWRWGIVPLVTLAFVLYLSFRYELFASVEEDGGSLGTVLLPLASALLLGLLWRPGSDEDYGFIAIGGLMTVSWGDAMATIIGRRTGTRRYLVSGHARTMEGTLAMFFASSVTMTLVLVFMGQLDWHQSIGFAMIAATVAASVESVSIHRTDNLTVALTTAATLYALVRISG